ncbi:MAG: MaoC family dehydratase [Nitrososphaerales archaeon]
MGLYFDEISVGQQFESSSRVLAAEDLKKFAALTGDFNRLHLDADYAKTTEFKRPISHGLLILGIAFGLWYALGITADSIIAFIGINKLSFRMPAFPGDTIHLRTKVVSKRESKSRSGAGIVTFDDSVVNQEGSIILEFERVLLLKKKESRSGVLS